VLRPGPDGAVLVQDRAYARAYTLRVGRTDQSYVDLDDPRRLEFDYIQRIADVIDCLGEPERAIRIVHVGGAALTLARYVAVTRPRSAQLVLEPDAELTAFVREHLPLAPRSGIKVRAVDGRSGIAELRDGYAEVVVVDAFVGARVPADLTTVEFLTDLRRMLTASGVLIVNLTDRGPFGYTRRVLAGIGSVFPQLLLAAEPATLKGRRFGNVIVAGSAAALPVAEVAGRAGLPPFPYRVLHGARLSQLVGGAAPFQAEDGEPSPEPPRGLIHFG
jgi:spermidine synthase